MNLKLFQDGEKEIWDSFVRQSESGTVFHTWDWLKIAERYSLKTVFRKQIPSCLHPIGVYNEDGLVGIFPLFYYDVPFFGIVASPPLASEIYYLGPVLLQNRDSTPEQQQIQFLDFFNEINEYIIKTLHPRFILFHTTPGITDMRPLKWSGYDVEPRYTYEIDLKDGKDAIWKRLTKSVRYSCNKAEKAGVVVRDGSKDDLLYLYNLLRSRNRIHTEYRMLSELFDRFYPDNLRIFIAYHEGKPLSGIVSLMFNTTVYFWIGSPKFSFNGFSPNEVVLWNSIQWAIDKGYSRFEIMGADDFSLFPFKRKFNPSINIYFTARWFTPFIKVAESTHRIFKSRY